ncbi:MAG: hypothetical protein AAF532_05570 [Planctomycetota bacterium]
MFGKMLIAGAVALGTGMLGSADPSSALPTASKADAGPFYGYGYGFAPRSFYYGTPIGYRSVGFGPRYYGAGFGSAAFVRPGFGYRSIGFRRGFVHPGFGYRSVGFRRGFVGGSGVFIGGRRGFVSVGF